MNARLRALGARRRRRPASCFAAARPVLRRARARRRRRAAAHRRRRHRSGLYGAAPSPQLQSAEPGARSVRAGAVRRRPPAGAADPRHLPRHPARRTWGSGARCIQDLPSERPGRSRHDPGSRPGRARRTPSRSTPGSRAAAALGGDRVQRELVSPPGRRIAGRRASIATGWSRRRTDRGGRIAGGSAAGCWRCSGIRRRCTPTARAPERGLFRRWWRRRSEGRRDGGGTLSESPDGDSSTWRRGRGGCDPA